MKAAAFLHQFLYQDIYYSTVFFENRKTEKQSFKEKNKFVRLKS